ncbi:MAG: glutathione S-transferase family protein [Kofleriaceae bacterium]
MTYQLYSISGAPRPWRVMLGLLAKGLDFELHTLDASNKEHKAPAFLALNPRGRVPVLNSGELVVTESLAILAYLEKQHPHPPLFGSTAEEHAAIWQLVSEGEHYVNDATSSLLNPLFFQGKDDTDGEVQRGATAVREEMRRLDGLLARSRFLAGERMTAADCVCFPHARLVLRATERFPDVTRRLELHPFERAFPHLAQWIARVETLPGYMKTFPPHWKAARTD